MNIGLQLPIIDQKQLLSLLRKNIFSLTSSLLVHSVEFLGEPSGKNYSHGTIRQKRPCNDSLGLFDTIRVPVRDGWRLNLNARTIEGLSMRTR